jgi:hypothetical protein
MQDLVRRIKKCDPCPPGLIWLNKQTSKKDILNNCRLEWKIWAVKKGILEFLKYMNYNQLTGYDIAEILRYQPQLINEFDLSILTGRNISDVLRYQPDLIDYFDLDKLHKHNIVYLLIHQPKMVNRLNIYKLGISDIACILVHQPSLFCVFLNSYIFVGKQWNTLKEMGKE